MRTTFVFALLAAVAAASPGRSPERQHHHQPHWHQSVCTTTKYTSTTTITSTLSKGTATSTTTTTTTSLLPIVSCAAPTATSVGNVKRGYPGRKPTPPHNHHECWSTTTVSRVSTVTSISTVASTTTTSTSTVVSSVFAATQTDFAGPFLVYDQSGADSFTIGSIGSNDYLELQNNDDGAEFSLEAGAISILQSPNGDGDSLYTDNNLVESDGVVALSATEVATDDALGDTATLLACSISQNSDGTCPLTCSGNGGSQFYYCAALSDAILIDGESPPANCGGTAAGYTAISAFVVSAPTVVQCPRSLEGRSC